MEAVKYRVSQIAQDSKSRLLLEDELAYAIHRADDPARVSV